MIYHYSGMSDRVVVTAAAALLLLSTMQVGAESRYFPSSSRNGDNTGTGSAVDPCTVLTPLTGGTQHCSSNGSGNMGGGYSWTIWSSGSGGCITTYDNQGCAFKATWNNSGDFLARTGLGWNSTKTYTQLGTITATFAETKTGTGGGYSYIGIYGWSKNPLIEYYIIDDWYSKPNPGTKLGTITVDGGTYNVIKNTRVNQPSIVGTATFDQFFSVRTAARQCGQISISEHFKKWDSLGLKLGNMYEARILVEAGGGNGSIDFTEATVTAGTSSVSPVPRVLQGQRAFQEVCKGSGVLSLFSLNGAVIRSVRQHGSEPEIVSTENLARGMYILQFRGDGKTPVTGDLRFKW
jgi:hypothetical protein